MDGAADDNSSAAAAFIRTAQQNIDFTFQPQLVLPGDDVTNVISTKKRFVELEYLMKTQSKAYCPIPL